MNERYDQKISFISTFWYYLRFETLLWEKEQFLILQEVFLHVL